MFNGRNYWAVTGISAIIGVTLALLFLYSRGREDSHPHPADPEVHREIVAKSGDSQTNSPHRGVVLSVPTGHQPSFDAAEQPRAMPEREAANASDLRAERDHDQQDAEAIRTRLEEEVRNYFLHRPNLGPEKYEKFQSVENREFEETQRTEEGILRKVQSPGSRSLNASQMQEVSKALEEVEARYRGEKESLIGREGLIELDRFRTEQAQRIRSRMRR